MPGAEVSTSDCFLVVFSIADRMSFLKAGNIVSILRSFSSSSSTPLTLLGNKKDLDHSRQVSIEELKSISSLLKCDYSEVSVAESREDIVPIIFRLLKRVLATPPLTKNNLKKPKDVDVKTQISSNSNSEPCLNQDKNSQYETNFYLKTVKTKNAEDNKAKSEKQSSYEKETNEPNESNSTSTDRCQICFEIHRYKNVSHIQGGSQTNLIYKGPEFSFKKIRTTGYARLVRTKSLQGKERRNKHNSKANKLKKYQKNNSFRVPNQSSEEEQKLSNEMKKDSMFSSFLNCSKSSEEPKDLSYCQNILFKDSFPKNEYSSIASLFLRGRSFIQEETASTSSYMTDKAKGTTCSKTPLRARKTLPSKCLSVESSSKSCESKKLSFDVPKSPTKGNFKCLQERQKLLQVPQLPLEKPDYGDLPNTRSFNTLDSSFLKLDRKYVDEEVSLEQSRIPEKRERKFGVFGRSVLGNVFSKTSLPDLPRATASFYTKIDSIKRTIQKRSV